MPLVLLEGRSGKEGRDGGADINFLKLLSNTIDLMLLLGKVNHCLGLAILDFDDCLIVGEVDQRTD